ncbi:MAG TPA: hypothetical protein DCZ95_17575 [Verrucomicrobia bacterium]|nr:MAG: hypothetical protein A2X46_17645 [Lentisphaerae bacterium GWF2_57_35]HBA85897.1 hypothetical protein [Verrucomicrobiota bacterium]
MNKQWLTLLRILLNPQVTDVPRRVLKELRNRGIQRIPDAVYRGLVTGGSKQSAVAFIRNWLDGEVISRHRGQWVVNSFMPPFPGVAFNRMFENLLSGRHLSPVSAYLAVTSSCPYDCWHCSLHHRKKGHLPKESWLSAIRQLHNLGVSIIGFTGGEPLLRKDLPELIAAASQGGAATVVFSSGSLLDQASAQELKQAGLWSLCVSLDHPSPGEFGRLRGAPDAYQHAVASLELARASGFYTMMSTVATRPTIEQQLYLDLYRLAQQLGVHEYRLIEPMPCGKLTDAGQDLLLTPAHTHALRDFHVTINRRRRLPKVCAFNQIESPEIFGCGAGTQHLFIDSAGEVCPCDFTPLSFGNLEAAPLSDIWRRMNLALGDNPRCRCFIQRYHSLISRHAEQGFPLAPELSESICAGTEKEPLPGYFALVNNQGSKR